MLRFIRLISALSAVTLSSSAFASVTYDYKGIDDSFSYVSEKFIQSTTSLRTEDFTTCSVLLGSCRLANFVPGYNEVSTPHDRIYFDFYVLKNLEITADSDFQSGAFKAIGHYVSEDGLATLDVTGVSSVPLPASAPMFGAALLGLTCLGYAAKRKKAAVAA